MRVWQKVVAILVLLTMASPASAQVIRIPKGKSLIPHIGVTQRRPNPRPRASATRNRLPRVVDTVGTNGDWSRVMHLPEGESVWVSLKGGDPLYGSIERVTEDSLVLAQWDRTEEIRRSEVTQVFVQDIASRAPSSIVPGALAGAAVGAVVSLFAGIRGIGGELKVPAKVQATFILGGAGLGAVVGSMQIETVRREVYRSN